MVIRVSGQRQKHGASLADEIAKWLLRFSGDHHLTTPDTSIPADPAPPPPDFRSRRRHRRHCRCSRRRRRYQRHRAGGRRRRRRRRVFRCRF